MLSIIAAVAKNNAIGLNNKLLCHLPEDLKRFKKITLDNKMIMGRKTFESLPGILKNRKHIVVSNSDFYTNSEDVSTYTDLYTVLKEYASSEEEVFVIGGESIYKQALPFCRKLYLTIVEKQFEADTFFPEIDYEMWSTADKSEIIKDEKSGIEFYYLTLIRTDTENDGK